MPASTSASTTLAPPVDGSDESVLALSLLNIERVLKVDSRLGIYVDLSEFI